MASHFDALQRFHYGAGKTGQLHSLPALEKGGLGNLSRMPACLRVVLESLVRNCDGKRVREEDVRTLAAWKAKAERTEEIPFVVARVLLQDFTGVPLIVDLAAMRSAVARQGQDPKKIEPLVPVDLVIDHSVQVDFARTPDAVQLNMGIEFHRNRPRYEFLKWGKQAFETLQIVPPGVGIVHQVNLEYLAKGVVEKGFVFYPDTLVGTDSHTTMINGLGIVAWGVGGIEAEAAMLGQPVYFLTPDVVGVNLKGELRPGVTATDLVLVLTELLRKAKVVGKFVEFHGEGAASLPVPERATIANMAPEYGATVGFFPVDEATCAYLKATGRSDDQVDAVRQYYKAQGLFGIPRAGQCDYSTLLELDIGTVRPSVAGPKRPQDRIDLPDLGARFRELFSKKDATGYGKPAAELGRRYRDGTGATTSTLSGGGSQASESTPAVKANNLTVKNTSPQTEAEMMNNRPTPNRVPVHEPLSAVQAEVGHGDVLIAAITSCTNTSNPGVMLAAGLLAKKAVEKGLTVKPEVKTSLAPGSRVVTSYLEKTGLQPYLDKLGFNLVGYGCTTCIGNSGPLDPRLETLVSKNDVVAASVLSGNRNFEARVHQAIKANFLMSPPLVVAFALAGRVDIDVDKDPIGLGKDGKPVFLRDIWPSPQEIDALMGAALDGKAYRDSYGGEQARDSREWAEIPTKAGHVYGWDGKSTYVREPPYFVPWQDKPGKVSDLRGARALAIFGDSVTTDHISPAGNIKPSSPAGQYLTASGCAVADFNSYGARRGNHEVMVRGTFANVRIKNAMVPGVEGGVTAFQPGGKQMSIYDASVEYQRAGTPLVVIAGHEYGTGSSRDWAAKGTRLLGVRAVVARSYERIHRSNLVMMGVLPCQFKDGTDASTLKLDGTESFDLLGYEKGPAPRQDATLVVHRKSGAAENVPVTVRIDTPIEVEYFRHGGILQYVLRQILGLL
ncbi:MAG: aconitate hydratase AcnA [Myxococcales bacterium]